MSGLSLIQEYYRLTKPGIIRGNLMIAVAAYLFASAGNVDWSTLAYMAIGTSLVIAAACVTNNYLDRGIDSKMNRTRSRALVTRSISAPAALSYAAVLLAAGLALLVLFTNPLTVGIGVAGFIFYVVIYGIAKRTTVHGTLIGSISGAMPPVGGYVAASNRLDTSAILLFTLLAAWQMPHFYAIAMYRIKDYAAAKLPVLPLQKGPQATKRHILFFIGVYIITALLLSFAGNASITYSLVAALIGLYWARLALRPFPPGDFTAWARKLFGFSLILLSVNAMLLSIDWLLP